MQEYPQTKFAFRSTIDCLNSWALNATSSLLTRHRHEKPKTSDISELITSIFDYFIFTTLKYIHEECISINPLKRTLNQYVQALDNVLATGIFSDPLPRVRAEHGDVLHSRSARYFTWQRIATNLAIAWVQQSGTESRPEQRQQDIGPPIIESSDPRVADAASSPESRSMHHLLLLKATTQQFTSDVLYRLSQPHRTTKLCAVVNWLWLKKDCKQYGLT